MTTIHLPVDPGYAYDYLAILMVKQWARWTREAYDVMGEVSTAIERQVGGEQHERVTTSHQFDALVDINQIIFNTLDRLKQGEWPGAATEIDQLVYKRYLAKKALQERFFADAPLTERKIGYTEEGESL